MLTELILLIVAVVIVVQFLRLLVTDCDLTLQWSEMFGNNPDTLKGKVVWVTGASSGIGEYLIYRLASAGCRLVLSARRESELIRVRDECLVRCPGMKKENLLVLPLDVIDYETHKPALETVLKYFKQIDILVNNAGRSQRALCMTTTLEVDRECFEVNTLGPISLTRTVLPHMKERNEGQIVVVSSIAGKLGSPGLGSYSMSKHGVQGWFETLRIESHENNIKITLVCPGPVFSNALKGAFTEISGQSLGVEMKSSEKRVDTHRCAHLISVAMANYLDEVWISLHPELLFVYMFQYFPYFTRKLGLIIGQKRFKLVRDGVNSLH